ncbi:MAG TPA: hypothetical protein VK902_07890 [Rubrobacter sp.]|nr:hypothetical protein [Rubrobacter sp.]
MRPAKNSAAWPAELPPPTIATSSPSHLCGKKGAGGGGGEGGEWVLPYPAHELLTWAWQRWEVEVCHREMKSGFGLGEAQWLGPR